MSGNPAVLGVIGGTALFKLPFPVITELDVNTPFGQPSSSIKQVCLASGQRIYLLNRHGHGHVFSPSSVNYRANIWAMKKLGVTHLLSFSAVGSLQETIVPGKTIVVPTQLFDDTKGIRQHTFFEGDNDVVAHVSLADPICPRFASRVSDILTKTEWKKLGFSGIQHGGTYVVIEGPTFSTRAKSRYYKEILGADLVGQTAWPEAPLAREAGLHYAIIAFPADYDSWRGGCAGVTADEIMTGLAPFSTIPELILPRLVQLLDDEDEICQECQNSLAGFTIHSDMNVLAWEKRKKYVPLLLK